MSKKWIGVVLGLALFASSCAFKDSKVDEKGQPIVRMNQELQSISLAWEGLQSPIEIEKRAILRRDERQWIARSPVTLPTRSPDRIQVDLYALIDPSDLQGIRVKAEAASGESLERRELGIDQIEAGASGSGSRIQIKIRDLSALLSITREQRIFVTLTLQSPKMKEQVVQVSLTTPPSKLTRAHDPFELRRPGAPSRMPLILSSQAKSLVLLRTSTLRNDSFQTMRLEAPFRSEVLFSMGRRRYWTEVVPQSNPFVAVHEQRQEDELISKKVEVFVLPLVSNLYERWTALGQSDLSELRVSPNDSLTVGLYIDQADLASLERYPVSVPEKIERSVSAQASCRGERWGTMGATSPDAYCSSMRSVYGFSEEAVSVCIASSQLQRACQGGNAGACNEAALVDARLDREFRRPHPAAGIPWPIYQGCKTETIRDGRCWGINYGWEWTVTNASFLTGYQSLPASLQATEEVPFIPLRASFDTGNPKADSESRTMELWALPVGVRD